MKETQQTESENNKEPENQSNALQAKPLLQLGPVALPVGLQWILVCGGIAVVALLVVSVFLPHLSERVKFFTVNSLSLFILLVVAVQAYIYRRQWEAMDASLAKTDRVIEKMEAQSELLRRQAKSMDESVVFGLRAYVGIHSIAVDFPTGRLFIEVENIGRVPAQDVKVEVEIEVTIIPGCMPEAYSGPYVFITKKIPYPFGKAKLFPGNLNLKIIIPYRRWLPLSAEQFSMIQQGDAILVVRGNINFEDGFNGDKNTPFALRYSAKASCWLPHPILSHEEERKNTEEQPYYED